MNPEIRTRIVRSIGEECSTDAELAILLAKKPEPVMYDGFEPSGRMHIAQGIFKAVNVNKATSQKCRFIFWVADWFGLMNDKMGGSLPRIRLVGRYFVEVWKAVGMDMSLVDFRWCADEITANATVYWTRCLDIARCFSLTKMRKCCKALGRRESSLTAAQVLYPLMQATDIFFLGADICQLGVDQRKVNMIAREYASRKTVAKGRAGIPPVRKPIILGHHMLAGLLEGQAKMSKSNPNSAIFMEDSADEVNRKISMAYCPPPGTMASAAVAEDPDDTEPPVNPVLDYVKCIIFGRAIPQEGAAVGPAVDAAGVPVTQEGAAVGPAVDAAGVPVTFTAAGTVYSSYQEVETAYEAGKLLPDELRGGLAAEINALLEPVRSHFASGEAAALLEQVRVASAEAKAEAEAAPAPDWKGCDVTACSAEGLAGTAGLCWVLPSGTPSLAGLLNVFAAAAAGRVASLTIVVCDWQAVSLGLYDGDIASIQAACVVTTAALKSLTDVAKGVSKVVIMNESDLILRDSSKFWINVINTGRNLEVPAVCKACGFVEWAPDQADAADDETDAAAPAPAPASSAAPSDDTAGPQEGQGTASVGEAETLGSSMYQSASETGRLVSALMTIAGLATLLSGIEGKASFIALRAADVGIVNLFSAVSHKFPIMDTSAQREVLVYDATPLREFLGLHFTDNDQQLKKTVKDVFCRPGNIERNALLHLLEVGVQAGVLEPTFAFKRSEEHGGDLTCNSFAELSAAFASENVHPGDLKPSIGPLLPRFLSGFQKWAAGEGKEPIKKVVNAEKKANTKSA